MANNLLPVPNFNDNELSYSFKQNISESYRSRQRPPKLYPKHHLDTASNNSVSPSSTAMSISFQNEDNHCAISKVLRCSRYNRENQESYFEQCFEVMSRLGMGSFSEVFKVRSLDDGQLYAVKKSKQPYKSETYRQERIQEVRRYEQLSQEEHCLRLYYAWEQDNHLYMQLELCQENLESYVFRQQSLSEDEIWNILVDLLLALKALHDQNLIHLDVKLENIMVTSNLVCKLGDFGLVVDLNKPNLHQSCEGDSRYVAPELMQAHFTKAADVFSFGITALELACNLDLPNNGPLWVQLRNWTLPSCLDLVSPEMQNLIRTTMNPTYSQRPDVNALLQTSRIQDILQKRMRIKRVRSLFCDYPRQVAGLVNQTLCVVRRHLAWIALLVMTKLRMRNIKPMPKTPNRVIVSVQQYTPTPEHPTYPHYSSYAKQQRHSSNLLLLDDSDIESSPRMKATPSIGIANSTPLTANVGAFRKSRREYSMHSTRLSHSYLDDSNSKHVHSKSMCDESPSSNVNLSPKLGSKRKKLFSDDADESD